MITELAKYGERIERLTRDIDRQGDKLDKHSDSINGIKTSIDRVTTGAVVAGAILSIVAAVFWWAIGDKITAAVHAGLGETTQQYDRPQNAPQSEKPGR